jgi:type II secretory pathway component PulF
MSPVVRSSVRKNAAVINPPSARKAVPKQVRGVTKIVRTDLPAFSRQMAAMLAAGMPIVAALETLEEQAVNPNFKIVLHEVKKNIEGGSISRNF